MRIMTAGNWRFAYFIEHSMKQAAKFNYPVQVFDLGGLGFGEDWSINDQSFQENGYYDRLNGSSEGSFLSTARHKPAIVEHTLKQFNDFTVYLDGDAMLVDRIDEIAGDYDIGVTTRRPSELNVSNGLKKLRGWINAGVLFFNNTPGTELFLEYWKQAMTVWPDDQWALNEMLCKDLDKPLPEEFMYRDIKIRTFPGDIYNFCYFPEEPPNGCKIFHYRGINKPDKVTLI